MPEITLQPIELTDDELEAVSGGASNATGGHGGNANGGFNNFFSGANFSGGNGGNANGGSANAA